MMKRVCTFRLSDDVIRKFRGLTFEKYGSTYGFIADEVESALSSWYALHKDPEEFIDTVYRKIIERLSKQRENINHIYCNRDLGLIVIISPKTIIKNSKVSIKQEIDEEIYKKLIDKIKHKIEDACKELERLLAIHKKEEIKNENQS